MRPYGLFDIAAVSLANSMTLFPYVDSIADKQDFIGLNYYGQVLSPLEPSKLTLLVDIQKASTHSSDTMSCIIRK